MYGFHIDSIFWGSNFFSIHMTQIRTNSGYCFNYDDEVL